MIFDWFYILKFLQIKFFNIFDFDFCFNYFFLKKKNILFFFFFFKYSFFNNFSCLLDISVYEIFFKISKKFTLIKTCYLIFFNLLNFDLLIYIFSILKKKFFFSIEFFFKNGKWLEKENSDFYNIYFKYKVDRRNIYVLPLFYKNVLEKKFPVTGFFELFYCFFLKKLFFKHFNTQN